MDTLFAVLLFANPMVKDGDAGECKKAINILEAKNIIQVFRLVPIYCITANF